MARSYDPELTRQRQRGHDNLEVILWQMLDLLRLPLLARLHLLLRYSRWRCTIFLGRRRRHSGNLIVTVESGLRLRYLPQGSGISPESRAAKIMYVPSSFREEKRRVPSDQGGGGRPKGNACKRPDVILTFTWPL